MNDLHTADLAWEIAERLDGDALVNDDVDRNDLDLNRIGQIRARAPWFLDVFGERLEALQRRHGTGTVLFIHGWNVVNPACDVGVGAALDGSIREAVRAPHRERSLTVDDIFLAERIEPLRRACAERGIATGLGWRYPASSPTNFLQLFTPRYREDPDLRLRRLARLGERINAVQLELGIPLRFPGAWRTRFIGACGETFDDHPPSRGAPIPRALHHLDGPLSVQPAQLGSAIRRVRRAALQFHRMDGAIAGLVACDVGPRGSSGRVLLLRADGGLYLYTGEAPPSAVTAHGLRVGPLAVRRDADGGIELRLDGPLLRFEDTTPFLDLEAGLTSARVCEVSLELRFHRGAGAKGTPGAPDTEANGWPFGHASAAFGRASGWLTAFELREPGGDRAAGARSLEPIQGCDLSGHAFLDGDDAARGTSTLRASLPGAPSGPLRIVVPRDGEPVAHRYRPHGTEALHVATVRIVDSGLAATAPSFDAVLLDAAGRAIEVHGIPGASVPVIRQLRGGRTDRYELAFCRYRVDGIDAGSGWAEFSRVEP